MIKISTQCIFIIFLTLFIACKKDTENSGKSNFANSPTCAYAQFESVGAGQYGYTVYFLDLRSSTNTEKKYFRVQLKFRGVTDSFEVMETPQSINALGADFPSEITDNPGYGAPGQWTNAQYRLLNNGLGSFYQDTIVRNPQSNIHFLYQNYLAGPLKGEWPQNNLVNYSVPTGVNGETTFYSNSILYFKKGLYIQSSYDAQIKPLSELYKGAPNNYEWQKVDAAIQIANNVGPSTCNFYFLDFKNWRYFKWHQFMNNIFSPAQLATTFEGYQSLDNLFKWPEGWGKP